MRRISRRTTLRVCGAVAVLELTVCLASLVSDGHGVTYATINTVLLVPSLVCFFWPKKPMQIQVTTFVPAPRANGREGAS